MKTTHVLIAILAAVLLTACGGETQQNPLDPFIGGNIAVNLYLKEGMPPPEIYDGGKLPFGVNIVVQNVGEADIGPGTENEYMEVRLENILPSNLGVTAADLERVLETRVTGAKKNFDGSIIGGMTTYFVFENLNYQPDLVGNDFLTIRGHVCYDYSNIAKTQICMKDDIMENVQDSTLCSLTGEKLVHNTGGPIHVTQVIENPIDANKVQVSFILEHVNGGNGEFYGRAPDEDCDVATSNTNKYVVDVEVSANNPDMIVECNRLGNLNRGNITLYGGSPQTIMCTLEDPANEVRVYSDVLTIKTWYRYGQFIEQTIPIRAVPN